MSLARRTYIYCLEQTQREVYDVLQWLDEEWDYVVAKFGGVSYGAWDELPDDEYFEEWMRQALSYLDRAKMYGLDTIRGRQALAKACTTFIGFTASAVRRYGPLPLGGGSSTEDPRERP